MSSAGGDPLAADELPALSAAQAMVFEAPPDPPPGPERDALAAAGAARVDRAVALMETAVRGYNDRLTGVVEARMRSPKTRRGTRFWSPDQVKAVSGRGVNGSSAHKTRTEGAGITGVETKSIDASYVLPDRVLTELGDAVRPVGLRIVADAAAATAKSLGRPNVGLAAFDWREIENAVGSVVARMLEVNERHARDIRAAILDAEATAADLDEAVDRVLEAARRGGRWLLLNGRTLATALAGDAALGAAKALGVTHVQWVSRRDPAVRPTHRAADGSVRPVGQKFTVGEFRLRFPGDPEVLPAGAHEIYGCRCSLHWVKLPADRRKAVALTERGTPAAARRLLRDTTLTQGPVVASAPELRTGLSIPEVRLLEDVVGYRVLDGEVEVTPGQRVSWPGELALALAPPVAVGAVVLAVSVLAGTVVGVGAGAIVLPASAVLSVASVVAGAITAEVAAA